MRFEVHVHTEDLEVFRKEEKDTSGSIHIPETEATYNPFGLTHDKSMGRTTEYILDGMLNVESEELEKSIDWLFNLVKDKAKKISIGDLKGRGDYSEMDKEKILEMFKKWRE